ncbi:MAG: FkbM family methyltransferase [Methylococcaceae bacterium]|nr:FkbM family methyltransferase [Methylococcaceae bacterium]
MVSYTANKLSSQEQYINHMGVDIYVDPSLFSGPIVESIIKGSYESHEASQVNSLIQPGEVILEIGAGCGFISTFAAKNPNCTKVYAVEANPALIPVIQKTHEKNGVDITLYNEILGKEEGYVDFYLHEDFWASGTHSWLGKRSVKVKTTPFQMRLEQIRPTMIVCDIEGGELDLFDGVNLAGVKKILMELHQPTIGRHGMKKLFDNLSAQNFHYDVFHSYYSVVTFSHVDR